MNLILILSSVFLSGLSQILLKFGINTLKSAKGLDFFIGAFTNVYVWLGLFSIGISMILWVKVLQNNDVSFAYPFVSLSFIFVVLVGHFFMGESLNIYKIFGILFIIVGVLFIYYLGNK